jgi:hypothetical protein
MKLFEFFGSTLVKQDKEEKNNGIKLDDLLSFILEDDEIFKKHFFTISENIKKSKSMSSEGVIEYFMPMVKDGCRKFYEKNNMIGKLGKVFDKELRENLCQKLYDHYHEDIKKESYFY